MIDGDRLLAWFRAAGRELPWRGPFPREPYPVLVSEVMLQQTQVERVVAPFRRFMARFPSVEALASAAEDDVVHAFSGLGYYRRARMLHAAARAVVEAGGWPRTRAELARLPGLGAYTSAAVAAACFGGQDAPVDGNVARVAARLESVRLPLGDARLLAAAGRTAAALGGRPETPELFEALIELGATVCTPASPGCDRCPLAAGCRALAAGTPAAWPLPRPRRASERITWAALWLEREDGLVLLRRVDQGPLLSGMWLPPFRAVEGERPADVARALAIEAGYPNELEPVTSVEHAITHRLITIAAFRGFVRPGVAEARAGWRWEQADRPGVATSTLLAKLAEVCRKPHNRSLFD